MTLWSLAPWVAESLGIPLETKTAVKKFAGKVIKAEWLDLSGFKCIKVHLET